MYIAYVQYEQVANSMILNITDYSTEPLQSQIVRQISEKILNGELEFDTSLPSIRQLAHSAKVSVITVQRAYETLEQSGLICAKRGKGFFVSQIGNVERKSKALENLKGKLEPAINSALKEGLSIDEISNSIKLIIETHILIG